MGESIMGIDPISIGIMLISTAYQANKQAEMKKKMAREADKHKGFKFTQSGEAVSLPVVYGKQVLGGIATKVTVTSNYTHASTSGDVSFTQGFDLQNQFGSKNEFLHAQYALCHEGIDSVKHIKVNGDDYNNFASKFQHHLRTYTNGGSEDTIATANGFPSSNRMTGVANCSSTFKLNRDEQNYSGTPDLEFFVNGLRIKSIIKSGNNYSLSSSKTYSNNPALVLLDYLTNSAYGRSLSSNYIDLESFYNAARTCASIVSTGREIGGHVNSADPVSAFANLSSFPVEGEENRLYYATDTAIYYRFQRSAPKSDTNFSGIYIISDAGGTRDIPLYECNITIDTETNFRDNIGRILDTMGLAELIWSGEGKYKLLVEHPETQAELEDLINPLLVFTEDDIIRDSINIKWPSASERLNQATVMFDNEHEDFKSDSATWPPTGSNAYNIYLTEDNNQPFRGSVDGSGVTDPYHALALAEQAVRKARTMRSVSLTVSKKGLILEPGDFIQFGDDSIGLDQEIYRVESVQVNTDFSVKVSAYRFDEDMLAWNVNDNIAYSDKPTYDFTVDPITNLTLQTGATGVNDFALACLHWNTPHGTGFEYDVYFRRVGVGNYVFLANTGSTEYEINNIPNLVPNESFDFQVIVRSPFNSRSAPVSILNQALEVAPPQVTGINISEEQYLTNNASGLKNRVILSWSAPSQGINASYYKVEYKKNSETIFQVLGTVQDTEVTIPDVSQGVYQFKITAFSNLEFAGIPVVQNKTIIGFSQDPADPSGFSGNINEGQINLTWDAPTDYDVLYGGYSQIRFHAKTDSSASWDTASILVEKLSGNTTNKTVPTLKGTFFIRFYDAFDNFSANAVSFVSTFEDQTFNLIDTIDEDAGGFAGTKTNCSVVGGLLKLNTGLDNMQYSFSNTIDLGELTTVRLVPDIDVSVTVAGITVSTYTNISNVTNFGGPLSNALIRTEVRTNDLATGGTWSNWQLLTIGSYTTRRLQFRFIVETADTNTDVEVSRLHINLDKKDIIKTGTATSNAGNDTIVNFANPYYAGISGTAVPRVGFQVIGGSSGDNVVIVSRTKQGFTFSVYDSNGNRVARTIDFQAIGQ